MTTPGIANTTVEFLIKLMAWISSSGLILSIIGVIFLGIQDILGLVNFQINRLHYYLSLLAIIAGFAAITFLTVRKLDELRKVLQSTDKDKESAIGTKQKTVYLYGIIRNAQNN